VRDAIPIAFDSGLDREWR